MLIAAMLLMSVSAFAQTTVSLFPLGKVTMSDPTVLDQTNMPWADYWPDGKLCFLPETDGSGWVCYWGEGDTFRTKAATTHLEDHIANYNWQMAFGRDVNRIDGFNDGGSWVIGMHRLESGKLVGFFHAESWWSSGSGAHKSIGVTYSSDNGLTWEPGKCILSANSPKPQEAAWTGLGDGCVVWNAERQQYICYFQEVEAGGMCMAASSDPEGAAGTWKKWDGEDFTIEGCNQETHLGGKGVMIKPLDEVPGSSPSVMWNNYLNRWVMVYTKWGGDVYLSQSLDGIEWSSPILILSEPIKPLYPNLVSDEGDVVGGKNLRLYYSRNQNTWGKRELAYRTIEFDNSEQAIANIVRNSDLEGDDVSCFYSIKNGADGRIALPSTINDGVGKDGSRGIMIRTTNYLIQSSYTHFAVRLPQSLPAGTKYRLSFDYKAKQNADIRMESHGEPDEVIWWNFDNITFTPSWQHYERTGAITEEESTDENKMRTIAFNLNQANTYYFDNIVFEIEADQVKEPVIITVDNKTMTYGDDVPMLTYTSTATLNGTPKLLTTAKKISSVGTYPIMVERGTVTNDAVIFVNGTMTVEPASGTKVNLFQYGKVTMSDPIFIDQSTVPWPGFFPDGTACFLPETDGSGWSCYWGQGDTYRTKAATTHLEDHIANNNWQLAFGTSANPIDGFNNSAFIIGIHRLENGKLVAFFHAESYYPSGYGYKSIGVTYSSDNGLTWEPGKRILATDYTKPQNATDNGGLGDGYVVWNAERQQYICYYQEEYVWGLTMAASSDPEGAAGTWKKWDGEDFTIEGCNQETQTGGIGVPIKGLESVAGANPAIMWNDYLNCWVMIYGKWGGDTYISFSNDAINWEVPILLLPDEQQTYPSYPILVSDQGNLKGGKSMRLYYARNYKDGIRELAYRNIEFDNSEQTNANIVRNSDLEGDDVSCFYSKENGAENGTIEPATIVDGAGKDGSRGIVIHSTDNPPQPYNTQFFVRLPQSLPAGTRYRFSFDYKASQDAYVTMESQAEPGDYIWYDFGNATFTPSWQHYEKVGILSDVESTDEKKMRTIAFNLANIGSATTYYFDNIVFEIDVDDAVINFADANVKAVCVANWDTDHDGELSKPEAAAVTDLGQIFKGNTEITSFNELKYFKGLTAIEVEAFFESSLESITFPSTITKVGHRAFHDCKNLKDVDFNFCSAFVEYEVFLGCSSLEELYIPNTIQFRNEDGTWSWNTFNGCTSLKRVEFEAFKKGQERWSSTNMFVGCPALETVVLPSLSVMEHAFFLDCNNLKYVTILEVEDDFNPLLNNYEKKFGFANAGQIQFTIPDGSAEKMLKAGYMYLSDSSGLPLVRQEFEAEATLITAWAETFSNGDKSTLTTAISEARAAVNTAEDYVSIYEQITAIKQAAKMFLATATCGNDCDVTAAYVTNPNFDRLQLGWSTAGDYFTWPNENERGWTGSTYENGDVIISNFIQSWDNDKALLDGEISQTITALPAGQYRLELDAIAAIQYEPDETPNGVTLFAGNEQKTISTEGNKPQHFSIEFEQLETGDCKIGIKMQETNVNWVAIDNVRLISLGKVLKGDANGDGFVTIADAVAVVNYSLGNASGNFVFEAADVNGDNKVTITDAVGIVNMILNQ